MIGFDDLGTHSIRTIVLHFISLILLSFFCRYLFGGAKFWSTRDPGQQPFSFRAGTGSVILMKCYLSFLFLFDFSPCMTLPLSYTTTVLLNNRPELRIFAESPGGVDYFWGVTFLTSHRWTLTNFERALRKGAIGPSLAMFIEGREWIFSLEGKHFSWSMETASHSTLFAYF